MIKAELRDGDKTVRTLTLPESWDEMTATQVRYVFEQYEKAVGGSISQRQFEILIVYNLVGLKRGPSFRAARNRDIVYNVNALCEYVKFIYLEGTGKESIPQLSFRSIQNPLPRVTVRHQILEGPAALCQDLTFGEFRNAAMALNQFFKTEDPAALHECIAHLYRPRAASPNKAGRMVKPVQATTIEKDIRTVAGMKSWQKNLIMLWFASCINYLQTGNITLGGEDIDLKKLFSDSDDPGAQPATWNDLLIQIAREGAIGNTDAVDEAPLMVILLHMWSNYKENKRNERNLKKAKKA